MAAEIAEGTRLVTNEPPNDKLAEQFTLGSMLISNQAISTVAETLKEDHFYHPTHRVIFNVVIELVNKGEPVDAATVAAELGRRGGLIRIGGAPYLLTLAETTPTGINAGSYARVVYDRWRQRQIIEAGRRLIELGSTEATTTDEVESLLASADALFKGLGQPTRQGLKWDALVDKWRNWSDDSTVGIVPTPWPELNAKMNGGAHKGQMIIIGGRPGDGKSNAGLNINLGAAELGFKSIVFSVEMDDVEVCSRLLAAGSWSSQGEIMGRRMTAETMERVETYIEQRKGMDLELVDQAYITVEQIVSHCRLRQPDIIFVDYAQLISPSNSKVSREQQVAHITRTLKVAAKSLQMVVVVAAQLNRGPADGRVPVISDLRESGAAEQDADVVMLLHRPVETPGSVAIILGKNRNGPTGSIMLSFRGEMARIG